MQVPVNTGIAEARIGGVFGRWTRDESLPAEHGWRELFAPDPRYGHSAEHELIANYVVEGVERLERFGTDLSHPRVLYDPENLGGEADRFSCLKGEHAGDWANYHCPDGMQGTDATFAVPRAEQGLHARVSRGDGRHDAALIPLLRPRGQHGIYNAQSFRAFDTDTWAVNYTLRFLGTRGRAVDIVDGCDCSAGGLPDWRLGDSSFQTVIGPSGQCTEADLKLCTPECAEAWGLVTPTEPVVCGG